VVTDRVIGTLGFGAPPGMLWVRVGDMPLISVDRNLDLTDLDILRIPVGYCSPPSDPKGSPNR